VTESSGLRVGLNLLYLVRGAGGAGRYAEELMPALLDAEPETKLTAFVTAQVQEELLAEPWAEAVEWVRYAVRPGTRRALSTQMLRLPIAAARRHLDVLHSPANIGVLKTVRAANVVTLLDLIWLHPETSPLSRRERLTSKLVFTRCARAADRILTISEATKADLIRTIGLEPSRIDVTPLGVRVDGDESGATPEAELRSRLGLGGSAILLCVAQKQPHKNLASLIRALAELDAGTMLVLAGQAAPHEHELRALTARLGIAERVRFLDWVSSADLEGLYRTASVVVLPSFIEGFGLPVLEAMRHGTPVACSDRSALVEVAGDAALLFDPSDQAAVTGSLRLVLGDERLRAELVRRGSHRWRRFTWDRTAAATLKSYRKAITRRAGLE
jgi:glycosyltransferase involved in cell wall biosynthesis